MNNNTIGFEIRKRVQQYQGENAIYYKNNKLKTWVEFPGPILAKKFKTYQKHCCISALKNIKM